MHKEKFIVVDTSDSHFKMGEVVELDTNPPERWLVEFLNSLGRINCKPYINKQGLTQLLEDWEVKPI